MSEMPQARTQPVTTLTFTVSGEPVPQGSMRAMMTKHMKFPVLITDNAKLKPWRKAVSQIAALSMRSSNFGLIGKNVPVRVTIDFYFEKPKSVRRLDKVTAPDLDKLVRSCGDALTGIVWEDDAQITELTARKLYGSPARAEVTIEEADFPPASLIAREPIKDSTLPF